MLQTTNNVFNTSLLKYVTPESLLAWHRVRLANLMAHNGKEWADVYKQYNSGIKLLSYVSSKVKSAYEPSGLSSRSLFRFP